MSQANKTSFVRYFFETVFLCTCSFPNAAHLVGDDGLLLVEWHRGINWDALVADAADDQATGDILHLTSEHCARALTWTLHTHKWPTVQPNDWLTNWRTVCVNLEEGLPPTCWQPVECQLPCCSQGRSELQPGSCRIWRPKNERLDFFSLAPSHLGLPGLFSAAALSDASWALEHLAKKKKQRLRMKLHL